MKYLTFTYPDDPQHVGRGAPRIGLLHGGYVIDLAAARAWASEHNRLPPELLPASLYELIQAGPAAWDYTRYLLNSLEGQDPLSLVAGELRVACPLDQVVLYPPLLRPMSLRDFYAFEGHVAKANAVRGREVPSEWYQFPVFYFTNPNSVFGSHETIPYPSYTRELDYELEVACIIARPGINIRPEQAGDYIFGYTIFNDWSARDVQREEMRVGLGPAKGKDFASSLGPWIVTPDELADRSAGRPGVYDLAMIARINGEERSRGSWGDLHYSFGEMIARASQDAFLLPGDVLGSGTVGTGCLLELTKGQGPYLQPGDLVELEIERIGKLVNRVGKKNLF